VDFLVKSETLPLASIKNINGILQGLGFAGIMSVFSPVDAPDKPETLKSSMFLTTLFVRIAVL